MVAYFYQTGQVRFLPKYEPICPGGLPVLRVALPLQYSSRRMAGMARRLYRKGIRRYLAHAPAPALSPLTAIDPLPLCRAKGAQLLLDMVSKVPPWERCVALRGEAAEPEAWRIAEELCPQVGMLYLDFDRGEEALRRRLRERFGAAALHLGQGPAPQAALELAQRTVSLPQALRLWGEADLLGRTLLLKQPLPAELPQLPFLELLWETGRVELKEIQVARTEDWP